MAELKFEWDEDKAAHNLAKHGVSFLTAAAMFASEIVERIDDREDYGEVRFIALGRVDMAIFRVVYTWRSEEVIRIISAQKAGKNEREIYYRQVFGYRDRGQARAARIRRAKTRPKLNRSERRSGKTRAS